MRDEETATELSFRYTEGQSERRSKSVTYSDRESIRVSKIYDDTVAREYERERGDELSIVTRIHRSRARGLR